MADSALAFESDELKLTEAERAAARYDFLHVPPVTIDELVASIQRNGADPAILDAALTLPLEQYYAVKEIYDKAEKPTKKWRMK